MDKREQTELEVAYAKWEPNGGFGKWNWEAFSAGFDAGHAAADDWVAIEGNAENLPKDAGRYLFRDILGNAKTEVFDFQDWNMLNDITKGFFLSLYVAWMPIPEYQRPTDEERNK